jgi:hypothetical protein
MGKGYVTFPELTYLATHFALGFEVPSTEANRSHLSSRVRAIDVQQGIHASQT